MKCPLRLLKFCGTCGSFFTWTNAKLTLYSFSLSHSLLGILFPVTVPPAVLTYPVCSRGLTLDTSLDQPNMTHSWSQQNLVDNFTHTIFPHSRDFLNSYDFVFSHRHSQKHQLCRHTESNCAIVCIGLKSIYLTYLEPEVCKNPVLSAIKEWGTQRWITLPLTSLHIHQ